MEGSEKPGNKEKMSILKGSLPCSICLDLVLDASERSIAKLKCGHSFHLDCIGSAFNAKGIMQCPNCRDIEDGNWMYANGCTSQDDVPFEDIVYEDDYDIYGVSEFIFANEDNEPVHWCPYQNSYPQFSVSLEDVEPSPSGYPEVVVNVVYGDILSGCPFGPSGDARSAHQLGYDSTIGALGYAQNEPLGADSPGAQSFPSVDNRTWSHPVLPVSNLPLIEDSRQSRFTPIDERRLPYRVLTDIRSHQRSVDTSSSYSIWGEPYAQASLHGGAGRPAPIVSFRNISGSNVRRWRNRGPIVSGRSLHPNSHIQANWGILTSSGGQEIGIPSIPETNWQGDQGIPWRRDGFCPYPWVVSDGESHRWTSVGSSSSQNSYFGVQDIGNSQIPSVSAYQGYASIFQHDRTGDMSATHSHSMRPTR